MVSIPGIADPVRFMLDFLAFYAVYLIFSVSTNLEYGYAGIPNLGKVMFFAGGAFTVGALATRIGAYISGVKIHDFVLENTLVTNKVNEYLAGHPLEAIGLFLILLGIGALVSMFLGYLASYPAIRLRVDYLGITLLVSGEILRYVAKYYDPVVGGTYGTAVPDPFYWLSGRTTLHDATIVAVMMGFAISVWFYVEKLARSPLGRSLRAVRDDELAAEVFGKDIVRVRRYTLMAGSALAGIAGALYAFYVGAVHPDDYTTVKTFIAITMVIIGGVSNNAGAALGSFVYVLVDRLVRQYKYVVHVPFDLNYLAAMMFSVTLLVMLIYRPDGILPEKPGKTVNFEEILRRVLGGSGSKDKDTVKHNV